VDTMLRMAGVRADDFLIDLGSGDGRIIITAVQEYKAQGFGVDYDPRLVRLANENARKAGVEARARFLEQNVFKTDLAKATVVTMYLLPEYNAVLKPTLFGLKPGTRIVSHDYGIDDWEPDAQEKIAVPDKPVGADKASWIYYWMVPAKVEGRWRSRIPGAKGTLAMEIDLRQKYQKVEGTAKIGDRSLPIEKAALKGTALAFDVVDGGRTLHIEARLNGKQFTGQVAVDGRKHAWRAVKVEARGA
jgi:methylase of polypeptide subunit release factors